MEAMTHALLGFQVVSGVCLDRVRHIDERDIEGWSRLTRDLGGATLVLTNWITLRFVYKLSQRERRLTGAEKVLVIKPSKIDERFGTPALFSQDRPCNVFACGIRGADGQQIAKDTDVDQPLLHPFRFS